MHSLAKTVVGIDAAGLLVAGNSGVSTTASTTAVTGDLLVGFATITAQISQ